MFYHFLPAFLFDKYDIRWLCIGADSFMLINYWYTQIEACISLN